MKNYDQNKMRRTVKENLTVTTEICQVLREVNCNASWKNRSSKFAKTKTINIKNENKFNNIMTEEDLDRLFQKSKQKTHNIKLKTEAAQPQVISFLNTVFKDFTKSVKFLRMQDQNDKLLTGLPNLNDQNDENLIDSLFHDKNIDLTSKFKKDYLVGKVIGQGAYASVRLAIYRPEDKKIAIKAYEKSKIKEIQRKKSVRREIRILQMLNHPNIVKIKDVVETNNHLNIIMEYLPGISLNTSLKNQPGQRFSENNCKQIVKALANALSYLHQRNISHRDVKLENIILDQHLNPKLIDFGFSTCIERPKKIKIFCGTPSYMAPEIVQKKQYRGEAADIWALGVLLYVLITGNFPFKGATDQELYKKINGSEYPKNQISFYKDVTHLLSKIFVINPDERITASDILSHPWLFDKSLSEIKKNKKNESIDMRKKLLTGESKERDEIRSKKKQLLQTCNERILLRTTKDLSSKLNSIYAKNKLEKTLTNALREQNVDHSMKKKKQNFKILDLLKMEINKRKEDKSKCKSHRL